MQRYLLPFSLFLLIGVSFSLLLMFFFSKENYAKLNMLQQNLSVLQHKLSDEENKNNLLIAKVNKLEGDLTNLEAKARYTLGFVKKNETYYQVIKPQLTEDDNYAHIDK